MACFWNKTIDILEDFPELTKEDIYACLKFAAERENQSTYILT